MTQVVHQVAKRTLAEIRTNGLVQRSGGERRDDAIQATDAFLNSLRPQRYITQGLDRERNVYGYIVDGGKIRDITSGTMKQPQEALDDSSQVLLTLTVDPDRCFVSDLDRYDRIKECVSSGKQTEARRLAHAYWQAVHPLSHYQSDIRRPEIMITYDIPPSAIADETISPPDAPSDD